MTRPRLVVLLVVALLAAWSVGAVRAEAPPAWKAGLAQAKITPEKPMWLAGYGGRNRPSEGTLHDLWLKVLVLEAPGPKRGVVVTSDLLGFPKGMSERIAAELGRRFGLERSQVMLTATHTHSGPVLKDALYDVYPLDDAQRALIDEYSAWLEKKTVETVAQALEHLVPATLEAGEGTCSFAANRRNNRDAEAAALLQQGKPPKGPSDHAVSVLAVRGQGGDKKLLAAVFGYACHNTTLNNYEWSGDYAGFAQLALEKAHPGAAAMFYIGCGADQNPMPRRSVDLCRKYGEELAAGVETVLAGAMRPVEPKLAMVFDLVELKFERNPTKEELEKAAPRGGWEGRWAARLLRDLEQGKSWAKGHAYPIQVWKLGGDQLWIALGGEVVVDYQLKLKEQYGPRTWVAGYTNDVMAYIPSHRVWKEGGYEAGAFDVYGLPTTRWEEGIEQKIMEAIGRLVERVR